MIYDLRFTIGSAQAGALKLFGNSSAPISNGIKHLIGGNPAREINSIRRNHQS